FLDSCTRSTLLFSSTGVHLDIHSFPTRRSSDLLSVLYALIAARLAVSVTNSAHCKTLKPDDPYVTVSEAPAWEALERLAKIHPRSEEHTSELQSPYDLVCRLLLEKKK